MDNPNQSWLPSALSTNSYFPVCAVDLRTFPLLASVAYFQRGIVKNEDHPLGPTLVPTAIMKQHNCILVTKVDEKQL